MNSKINQQIIDKYILEEFGEISNPITKNEMIQSIYDDNLTLEQVKLWALFGGDLLIKGNEYGRTILHSASRMGHLDIVEYVLDKGVDVDSLNNFNETPLIYASWNNDIEMINLLLDKRANINHQDKWGWSALHYACCWNQLESVKVLIENNIDIYLKGYWYKQNETALDVTKYCGYQQIIDYLEPFYLNL